MGETNQVSDFNQKKPNSKQWHLEIHRFYVNIFKQDFNAMRTILTTNQIGPVARY